MYLLPCVPFVFDMKSSKLKINFADSKHNVLIISSEIDPHHAYHFMITNLYFLTEETFR